MVLGFGCVVAAGPVVSCRSGRRRGLVLCRGISTRCCSIVVIAGLTHPHAYPLYLLGAAAASVRMEEAARTVGATPLQAMTSVSLPMGTPVHPLRLRAAVLLGLEVFGFDAGARRSGRQHGAGDYLYKLTNKLGTPSYHLMAAVAVVLICITIPLVMLQRR